MFSRSLARLGFAVLLCCAGTDSALAVVALDGLQSPLRSQDARTGSLAPLTEATALVAAHPGWQASWTRFGTVAVLQRRGAFLASGLDPDQAHAEATARNWIRQNRALFRLSDTGVDALQLVRGEPLNQSQAQVLMFAQAANGVRVQHEGRIKIGLVGDKLFWVASSSIGDIGALAAPSLTPAQAWTAAATEVMPRLGIAVPALTALPNAGEWSRFAAPGYTDAQRVRSAIVGIPGLGAVPAFEANVVHNDTATGLAIAYTAFVDAANGRVLLRQDRVAQLSSSEATRRPRALTAVSPHAGSDRTEPFGGAVDPLTAGSAGPCHGPFSVGAAQNYARLVATAAETVAANDISVDIYFNDGSCAAGASVAHADTATSPESAIYTPASGRVPSGDYYVQVRAYADLLLDGSYNGTMTFNEGSAVSTSSNAMWKHFRVAPSLDYADTDTREASCWFRTDAGGAPIPECTEQLLDGSSHRIPWDYVGNAPSQTTRGNNATSVEGWNSPIGGASAYQPAAQPSRNYSFPWANTWHASKCDPTVINHAVGTGNDIDAAIVNLNEFHNRLHDFAYQLGLRERTGVAQLSNYGQTEAAREQDAELGVAQAGAPDGGFPSYQGRDNANQITLQDGVTPISNMYLWQTIGGAAYAPCVDGDFDAQVFSHEYGHMVQGRMTDPDAGLSGQQGRSMGEGWSDMNALMFLDEYGYSPDNAVDKYALGSYISGDQEKGIRNYAMNANPLNLSDIGYDVSCESPITNTAGTCEVQGEVHSDAEPWVGMQLDVRAALIAKYDALGFPHADAALRSACAEGRIAADHCSGERRWAQLIHDGMILQPSSPTYLIARDAILAADLARSADASQSWPSNQDELWNAMARRGWGADASTTGPDDIDPIASWRSPQGGNVNVRFDVRDEAGAAVTATIFVGQYEGRATPAADTDAATGNLADTIAMRAGSYDFVVRADGYGHARLHADVSGSAQTISVNLPRNFASKAAGATVNGMGTLLDQAIDEREGTNWEWSVDVSQPTETRKVNEVKPYFTVALAGGVHLVTRVQVSGNIQVTVGDPIRGRFSSLEQFALATCDVTAGNDCTQDANFTTVYTSPAGAFPSARFRPVVRDMLLREFRLPAPVQATHVRLIVLHNKCSGYNGYWGYFGQAGQEDNDATNNTDCRISNGKLYRKDGAARVAELEIFGSDPGNDRIFYDGFQ